MVKSVLSVSHRGLKDWVIQRLSAIVLAISSLGLLGFILFHPHLSFLEWKSLFAATWVKILALLCLLSLVFHAWIGIWTIITDYINCYIIRCVLNIFVFLMLFASFIWGLLILWSA
jgi:succinate dehydrogenase / fumarate reductase membrane anchor subunit